MEELRGPHLGKKLKYLRDIKEYRCGRQSTDTIIPKLSFLRLMKKILKEIDLPGPDPPDSRRNNTAVPNPGQWRFQRTATECCHEATESLMVEIMEYLNFAAIHAKT